VESTQRGLGGGVNGHNTSQSGQMLVAERDQGTPRLLGDCRIHRIGPTQAVLGRQRSGLVTQSHIQRHHGHVREPSQDRRERRRSERVILVPRVRRVVGVTRRGVIERSRYRANCLARKRFSAARAAGERRRSLK
jgi:hypothetical protein